MHTDHTDQQGTHVTTNEQGQPVLIIDFAPFDTDHTDTTKNQLTTNH